MGVGEDIPEPQGFVACSSYDSASIRTHCQVEHPVSVSSQRCNFLHLRVFPNIYFVMGIAMGAHDFIQSFTEHQVAHLRTDVYRIQCSPSQSVPESNCPVGCSPSRNQQSVLMGRPSHGLHCSHVVVEFKDRLVRVVVPDQ